MTVLEQTKLLVAYLKDNMDKVIERGETFNHPSKFTFIMLGQYDPADIIISSARHEDHLTRPNIMLGSGKLTKKRIQEIIEHEESQYSFYSYVDQSNP